MTNERRVLVGVCAVVIGIYAYMARPGPWESLTQNAAGSHYNLLVEGFRAGQLSLKKEVPIGFAQLADPYDPAVQSRYFLPPYWMLDLSYYRGRLYLYFGVTPALILFWPFVALTGYYLSHRLAVLIFCIMGFLASVGVLYAAWRRYFSELSVWMVAACALALGLATVVPVMLPRSGYNEVAISCGYMLTMLALGVIWCALHDTEQGCRWLMAASVAYGLAVGARPSLLFGAAILLVPLIHARRDRRRLWLSLLAVVIPITLIGLALMLYNALRFNNPFEFGQHYQLAGRRQDTQQFFSLHYLWFNFRVYFLEPARWSARFPFVQEIALPPLPAGYDRVETPFGVLSNIPIVWLALAVPLAWRGRSGQEASTLRWFATATALLWGICALTVGLYWSAVNRYEVDFLPALLLLAVIGILGLERALADRPVWRRAARWGWSLLLVFSVAFNLLASVGRYAEAHYNLGGALARTGKLEEAIAHYELALRIKPDYAEAHYNLGMALAQTGKIEDAIAHLEQALRIKPDYAQAHCNLGTVFLQEGKVSDAIGQYERALQINPDFAEAHCNLGTAFLQEGKVSDAIGQYERALQIKPDYAEAHSNLGDALVRLGKLTEAIAQYQQALKLRPDFLPAKNALTRLGAGQ
jgi:Tfp pilus assembly protein PilF